MFIDLLDNNLTLILTASISVSVLGVFLFCDNYKKISSLSVCFSSIILLFFKISSNSPKNIEILSILISLLLLFAATIAIGIGIANKIGLNEGKRKKDL